MRRSEGGCECAATCIALAVMWASQTSLISPFRVGAGELLRFWWRRKDRSRDLGKTLTGVRRRLRFRRNPRPPRWLKSSAQRWLSPPNSAGNSTYASPTTEFAVVGHFYGRACARKAVLLLATT